MHKNYDELLNKHLIKAEEVIDDLNFVSSAIKITLESCIYNDYFDQQAILELADNKLNKIIDYLNTLESICLLKERMNFL